MNNRMLLAWSGMIFICICVAPSTLGQDRSIRLVNERDDGSVDRSSRKPLTEDEMVKLRQQERIQVFNSQTSLDEGKTIHPDLMLKVLDNTMGVRYEEREAYLRILRLAHDVPHRWLERYATEMRTERRDAVPSYKNRRLKDFPQFVDLFTRPEYYRGRPVTIHGVMRKVTKFEVGKNQHDLDQAYEGWVYTPDSQGNPVVVVFTSKDERLPVSGDIQEEVMFTGYFFKMYGYDAQDTTRKAPLILAGEVECVPHLYQSIYLPMGIEWYMLTILGFMLGWYSIWNMNRRELSPHPSPQIEPDFNHFPPLEHPAPDPLYAHSMVETEDS